MIGMVACVPLIALMAARIGGVSAAGPAAILAAAWPQGLQLGGDVLSDMPHLALYLAAALLGGAAISRGRIAHFAICGVLAAAAYLVRQEALAIPVAVGGLWLWYGGHRGGAQSAGQSTNLRRRILGIAVLAGAFLLPLLPYRWATGDFLHKKTLPELLFGTPAAAAMHVSPHVIRAETAELSSFSIGAAMLEGWAKSGRYIYSTLALFGVLAIRRGRLDRDWTALCAALLLLHCGAVFLRGRSFDVVSTRYMLIPAAITIPYAALGWRWMVEHVAAWQGRADTRSLWAVSAILLLAAPVGFGLRPINVEDAIHRKAGVWLREHAAAADVVLAEQRLCQAVAYSGLAWNEWPERDWSAETTGQRASQSGARWFLYLDDPRRALQSASRSSDGADLPGQLLGMLQRLPPGANVVHTEACAGGRRVFVVRLREGV